MATQPFKSLIITFTLILGIGLNVVEGQSHHPIKAISFEGLDKTKPQYLKRFIKTDTSRKLDSSLLVEDAQYLSNIPFILNTTYEVKFEGDKATVIFICQEQQTLVPIINFGDLPNNLWFRVGASKANLFGKGITLSSFYQYYDRSSYQLALGLPFIGGSRWGANVRLTKWSTVEPLYFKGNKPTGEAVT